MMYKAIIVDDERLARNELTSLLKKYGFINILGEADNIKEAAELIDKLKPDVLFLDIQMPGGSGFDLLENCDVKCKIIFVTAFDEYALKAFDVNALDYLLKPIDPDRLEVSIKRLENSEMPAAGSNKYKYDDVIFILLNSRRKFLKISNILAINSAGDYTEIKTADGGKGITDFSMKEWEAKLPDSCFCRIHRSTIINIEQVDKLEEWINNTYRVFMRGLIKPYVMSRRYSLKIKNKLK